MGKGVDKDEEEVGTAACFIYVGLISNFLIPPVRPDSTAAPGGLEGKLLNRDEQVTKFPSRSVRSRNVAEPRCKVGIEAAN